VSKLRGAIYGCGMISEFHLRGWKRIPEVEIVALCNRTILRAEQRRDEFVPSAHVYSDFAAMLRTESLDFVDILTTPALHREHCRMAGDARVHVICQKPLADTMQDALAIAEDFRGYDKLFAIHENHRYRPWFERARSLDLGPLSLARFEHLNATEPGEAYKNETEQGILIEYGSHLVDMMRSVLGEPLRVYARTHRLNPKVRGESLVHAVYEYSEATAVVEVAWKDAAITQGGVLLAGRDGEAFYEGTLTRGHEGRFRVTRKQDIVVDEPCSPMGAYVESFYLLQRECTDYMLGRRATVVQTIEEHLKTLRCTFAAYDSARLGTVVSLQG
jgi:predicted dehydrogenase